MRRQHNNAVGPQLRSRKPTTGKTLPVLAFGILMVALASATQYFAHQFYYQAALGAHFNRIYPPWEILVWAKNWYGVYPNAIMQAGSIGTTVAALGLIGLGIAKVISTNTAKGNEYLHGSARWADKSDLKAAGLIGNHDGVYVGAWADKRGRIHYLRHNGPEHVLTCAPTRSGKGVGLVVPTLLSWKHSTVVTDLKGELWALTAGWRKEYARNKVLRFEPAAADGGVHWNPMDEIRLGTEYEVGDVQNLATVIVDPDGKGLESHWQKTSQALLVGVILHALYKANEEGTPATLSDVDAMLADPNRDVAGLWTEMIQYGHVDGKNHSVVGAAGRDQLDRPHEEAGSVLSTAKSYLSLYRDPVVARNVSCSDFRIKDLMNHDAPVSLYIVTQPSDKARLRPLVRVMLNMIVRMLADKLEFEDGEPKVTYRYPLLGMLDEFPSLGKLEILQESLAFLAAYGIKFYLICQDINQLKSRETGYGPDESITSNCHVQNAYPPNRVETAEHLSKLTGQTTVVKEQITTSGRRASALLGQVSRTLQEVQRPLLTVDECLRMPGPRKDSHGRITEAGDMIIYVAGYPAIYGKQPLYFQDPVFRVRAAVLAPGTTDRLRLTRTTHATEAITI
jgi:type IV secretion system protein VirD4